MRNLLFCLMILLNISCFAQTTSLFEPYAKKMVNPAGLSAKELVSMIESLKVYKIETEDDATTCEHRVYEKTDKPFAENIIIKTDNDTVVSIIEEDANSTLEDFEKNLSTFSKIFNCEIKQIKSNTSNIRTFEFTNKQMIGKLLMEEEDDKDVGSYIVKKIWLKN